MTTLRAATLAALVLVALIAGCGQQSSQRPAVAHYVKQVNAIESSLGTQLAAVTSAGGVFAQEQRSSPKLIDRLLIASPEQTLQSAWIQIRALRARLAAISTPPAAQRLRALLLHLIDGQSALTHEVAALVAFLPRYNLALGRLGPATKRLEVALSQQTAYGAAAVSALYEAKAAALRQFQATTAAIVAYLRRLHPPAVSRPGYRAQLTALKGMSASAGQLAAAIASGAPSNVGPLLARFDRAATSGNTLAVQNAEIAAARAYDARSAALNALSQRVERERLRLSNALT